MRENECTLVEFCPEHLEAVFAIQRAAYRPLYEQYRDEATSPYKESKAAVLQKYTRPGTQGYLFVKNGVPVGAVRVILYPETASARISALAVHPQHQGQSIAQQALCAIEQRHPQVKRWFLDTILQEAGNCHLYEKLGYRRTGEQTVLHEGMTLVGYEKRRSKL